MANTRTLTVEVVGDARDLARSMRQAETVTGRFGAAVGRAARLAGIALAGIGVAAIAMAPRIVAAGTALEAMAAKARTVFEGSLPLVEAWADQVAHSMGVTVNQAVGMAANLADLLKPLGFTAQEAANMSTEMLDLAAALSAWSGGTRSAAEVSEIMAAALTGEREALKGLGIVINEAEVTERALMIARQRGRLELNAQDRAIATQQLILEKSTDAQEAWSDGSMEAVRRNNEMRASLGELGESMTRLLYDALEPIIPVLTDVVEWLSPRLRDAMEWVREKAGQLAAWFEERVLPVLRTVAEWIGEHIVPVLQDWWHWIEDNIIPALGRLGEWIRSEVIPWLRDLWHWFEDKILPVFEAVVRWIRDKLLPWLGDLGLGVIDVLEAVQEFAVKAWDEWLFPFGQKIWGWVLTVVGWLLWLSEKIMWVLEIIAEFARLAWDKFWWLLGKIGDFVGDVVGYFTETLVPTILGLPAHFVGMASEVLGVLTTLALDILQSAIRIGAAIVRGIIEGLSRFGGAVGDFASAVKDAFITAFKSAWNIVMGPVRTAIRIGLGALDVALGPTINFDETDLANRLIPRLASGGIVRATPGGVLALLGEGGRDEAVIPLGSGMGPAVNITLRGDVFSADSVMAMLREIERRNGAVPITVARVA